MSAPARSCDGCRACCTALGVEVIGKPTDEPCQHEVPTGCGIYATRPEPCASFVCAWAKGLGRNMERPDRVGFVLVPTTRGAAHAFVAHPARPGALELPEVRARLAELAERFVVVLRYDGKRRSVIGPPRALAAFLKQAGVSLPVVP